MKYSTFKAKNREVQYQKSDAVKALERQATDDARLKHPTLPEYALAPRTFRDDTANGLTTCITHYITLCGGFASRINNQGTYRAKLGRYTLSTSRRGLADVMAVYKGFSLHIEVKIKRDVQSQHQRQVELDVNRSGGYYFIARDFTEFKEWFDSLSTGHGNNRS
jgi:hypothetical protein